MAVINLLLCSSSGGKEVTGSSSNSSSNSHRPQSCLIASFKTISVSRMKVTVRTAQ